MVGIERRFEIEEVQMNGTGMNSDLFVFRYKEAGMHSLVRILEVKTIERLQIHLSHTQSYDMSHQVHHECMCTIRWHILLNKVSCTPHCHMLFDRTLWCTFLEDTLHSRTHACVQ